MDIIHQKVPAYVVCQREQEIILPHAIFKMCDDPFAITPRERQLNIDNAIALESPDQLLAIFMEITGFTPDKVFALSQANFEEFLVQLYNLFGGSNTTNYCRDENVTIPMTLVYLAIFHFGGIQLKDEDENRKYLYELLAVNTGRYLEEHFGDDDSC